MQLFTRLLARGEPHLVGAHDQLEGVLVHPHGRLVLLHHLGRSRGQLIRALLLQLMHLRLLLLAALQVPQEQDVGPQPVMDRVKVKWETVPVTF